MYIQNISRLVVDGSLLAFNRALSKEPLSGRRSEAFAEAT
jgi:hypothetical protein